MAKDNEARAGEEGEEMKGIKESVGFDKFEGKANAYSQNPSSGKVNIVLSRPDGAKKMFAVSPKLAAQLAQR